MTHVCTIQELYTLVPETKKLEGANFKDTKELITSVIRAVEDSGFWEFVQYIQGNPSLFAVREDIRKDFKEIKEVAKVMKGTSPVFAEARATGRTRVESTRVETPAPTISERVAEKVEKIQSLEEKHGVIPTVTTPTKYPWQH